MDTTKNVALYGPTQAGKLLGLGAERVRQLEREGRIKAVRTAGGVRLFTLEEIQRFERERAATRAISADDRR